MSTNPRHPGIRQAALILSAALVLGGSSVLQPKLPLPGVSQPGIATQSNGSKAAPSDQPDQPWLPENVTGAGGLDRHSSSHPADEGADYLAQAFQVAQLRQQQAALKDMPPKAGETPLVLRQVELPADLISDGQFVWGPNVGDFDIAAFLDDQNSNLAPYAPDLAIWASYSSVNPRLLIAVLEMHHEYVTALPDDHDPTEVRAAIEDTAMTLAKAFYTYLHTWGDRRPQSDVQAVSVDPALVFRDGSAIQLDRETPSGTFALAAAIAQKTNFSTWLEELYAFSPQGFHGVYGSLFPESDPLDDSNDINPAAAPPDSLLMFPFPLGATWNFGGPHSWAGDNTPPFSSMDFYAGGGTCGSPPNLYSVASGGGEANRPYGYSCWLEIIHGDGWTTSYYHLLNMIDPQGAQLARNASLGTIACEVCAGGWATGPHVHWSLKYNGAYVSLEGVKATGWTIHVGPEAYDTGYIERDGVTLNPWSSVQNDYDLYYPNTNTSLRFYGNGQGDIDRVKVALDAPPRPVDVGAGDLTLEWWMKAELAENGSGDCTPGGDNWRSGNVLLDRDVYSAGDHGDFGVSLAGGRIAFGVNNGADSETLCGAALVADGNWHHVAVTRRNADGRMQIYVDGQLDAQTDGPDGDVSYHDGRTTAYQNDPYLVIGAEKHDAGPLYPSYSGWIDELRISNSLRYDGPYSTPTGPFTTDATTMGLYHLDEGIGDAVNDSSGYPGGPSNGLRMFGGAPAGPVWSLDTPFSLGTPTPTSTASGTATATATATSTFTPTASPTATATASSTPTATATASSTATTPASSTPSPTPTATPTAESTATATSTATSTQQTSPTPTPTATQAGPFPTEDINLDGAVNVLDVQLCVNVFLGTESDPGMVERSDVNTDGEVNVLDVQHIVNFILTG